MRAISSDNFRQNLKSYLKAIHKDGEPLTVTTKDGKNNVVVLSVAEYDSLVATAEISANAYLMNKIRRGEEQFSRGAFKEHKLN